MDLTFWAIVVVLVFLAWYTTRRKHKRLLIPLGELLDERSRGLEAATTGLEEAGMSGHVRGRAVTFSLRERDSADQPSQFTIALASGFPLLYQIKKRSTFWGFSMPASKKRITTGDPDMDKQLCILDLCGGVGASLLDKVMRVPALPEEFLAENRSRVAKWVRQPEIKNTLISLFSRRRVSCLEPDELGLKALYSPYRRKDVDPANVGAVLADLEVLVRSLESQAGPASSSTRESSRL